MEYMESSAEPGVQAPANPSTLATTPGPDGSNAKVYPRGIKFAAIMAAVCLLFMLVGLDSNIIGTAVPAMTTYFGTIRDIGWYTSAYRLMAGSFQLMFGKLYASLPMKALIIASLAIFTVGSLLCATATLSPVFIVGRAFTGCGTAGVISGAFAIVIHTTPLRSRSTYTALGASAEALMALLSPLFGGLLVDHLSWRWCFFVQLPLIAAASIIVIFLLDGDVKSPGRDRTWTAALRRLDIAGTFILVLGLTSLILALQWGGNQYPWSSWPVIFLLLLSALLVPAYVWYQSRLGEQATVPIRIARQRSVIFGFLFSFCNNGSLSIFEYYLPIYFQVVKELSASRSGLMVLPIAAGLVVSVPLAGRLTSKIGYYGPFMLLNSFLVPPAAGLLATVDADSKLWKVGLEQALLGFGTGIGFQGPQVAVQAIFSDSDAQIGIAIIQLAQALGPAVSAAGAQNIFAGQLHNTTNQGTALGILGPVGSSGNEVGLESRFSMAFQRTFYFALALACMLIIGAGGIEWRSVKKRNGISKESGESS